MTSHDPNHNIFCSDANGGVPEVVNNMLLFSLPGRLDLLPAAPKAWPQGTVRGLLARGQITIHRLAWDSAAKKVHAELTLKIDQDVVLRLPAAASIHGLKASGGASTIKGDMLTDNARWVHLQAGQGQRWKSRSERAVSRFTSRGAAACNSLGRKPQEI